MLGGSHRQVRKKSLDTPTQMSRTTQKSYRSRASDRIMVGTQPIPLLAKLPDPKASNHRGMKPSSGNHQLGWSPWNNQRAQGSQDKNSSTPETGLDAKDNIYVPLEGTGRIFFLTSPLIGSLTSGVSQLVSQLLNHTLHDLRIKLPHRGRGYKEFVQQPGSLCSFGFAIPPIHHPEILPLRLVTQA